MKIKFKKVKGSWRDIADSANTTIDKVEGEKEPSSTWKRRMLLCEHSPIRQLIIKAKWYELPYWVSVHFVRHWLGIIHWVRTQRSDRTNINRNDIPQGALVEHEIEANAQAIINISRKRLCNCASPETKEAWQTFLNSFKDKEPELYNTSVRECIYRGFCPEFKSCNYHKSEDYKNKLNEYRKGINE